MRTQVENENSPKGPIIGPLVLAGISIEEDKIPKLKALGVKDSKLLTPKKRNYLFDKILDIAKDHKIIIVEPKEIDEALNSDSLNLNWLEAIKFAQIINYLNPDKAVVDCPSPNIKAYTEYLMVLIKDKNTNLICEHKADINHPEVSAASILAKVTRDLEIEKIKKQYGDFGSGYLSDERTKKFFEKNWEKHPEIFRKTWTPYKNNVNGKKQRKLNEF